MPGQEGIPEDYVAAKIAQASNLGNLDSDSLVNIQIVYGFLEQHMVIFKAYAPFLVSPGKFTGPTDKDLQYAVETVVKDKQGKQCIARQKNVKINEAWGDVMQVAQHYIWPTGEAIRDYIAVLTNAINYWTRSQADRNKHLLDLFQKVLSMLKVCEVPQFDSYTELNAWINVSSKESPCKLMVALPRHNKFSDVGDHEVLGEAFRALDDEVLRHCSAERILQRKDDVRQLAKEINQAGDRGEGVFGYCFGHGKYPEKLSAPAQLFKHRFARIRIRKDEYKGPLKNNIILLTKIIIMSGLFRKWSSPIGIRTIEKLVDATHRGSIMAIKDYTILNQALDNLQQNPRDPVPCQVIDAIISYGTSRMKMEAAAERTSRELAERLQQQQGKQEKKSVTFAEPEKSTVDRLKETRLKASDNQNDSGMILPILLLGCALFLIMK